MNNKTNIKFTLNRLRYINEKNQKVSYDDWKGNGVY